MSIDASQLSSGSVDTSKLEVKTLDEDTKEALYSVLLGMRARMD